MHMFSIGRFLALAAALALWLSPDFAAAQFEALPGLGGGAPAAQETPITISAVIVAAADGQPVRLVVTADILPGWNTYSITQPPGGPVQTRIKVPDSPSYRVGKFQAVDPPGVHPEPAFDNLLVEEHRDRVTWLAPLELSAGADIATLEIKGSVFAQACMNVCLPPRDYGFTAKVGASPVPLPPVAATVAASSGPPAPSSGASAPPPPGGSAVSPLIAPNLGIPGIAPPPSPGGGSSAIGLAASGAPVEESLGTYAPNGSHLKWSAKVEPGSVAPGGTTRLLFTAEMEPKWHVYAIDAPQRMGNQATLFVVTDQGGAKVGEAKADRDPTPPHGAPAVPGSKLLPYYENQVTWSLDVQVPAEARPGDTVQIAGIIGFQTCDEGAQCDRPQGIRFDVPVTIVAAGAAPAPAQPIRFYGPEDYKVAVALVSGAVTPLPAPADVAQGATPAATLAATTGYDVEQIQIQSQAEATPLVVMLATALLAGFILNFMPCVLPVIGLKVLSFVEQGGHDRRRILMLNVWYALGIISVFLILATIPIVLRFWFGKQFGWGQQFSYDGFNITLVSIVFVMALSFLGVWEIPCPGFAGGKNAQQMAAKEGVSGAFIKGMITTVLATPCSGPFLGTAVAFAFVSKPIVTYAMFTAMGLGMASPYLLIGMRPSLIRFLPRPGEWMDTFKQIMGFVLIGTVIWLMLPIHESMLLPTIVLLAGLAAACWWIGRTPGYAEFPQKMKAWMQATAWSGLIGWFAFGWFGASALDDFHSTVDAENSRRLREYHSTVIPPSARVRDPAKLAWQRFSMPEFVADLDAGKTVMLEFTAKWCATCKTLKALNLDRTSTKQKVDQYGVVTYEIDIDELPPEEYALFEKLKPGGGVPLIAIFPAGKRYEPIRFGDGYTQSQILKAIEEAGPSKPLPQMADNSRSNVGM